MENKSYKNRIKWAWRKKEAFIWLTAIVWLALADPAGHHYTLCPLNNLGFSFCPGCGLGRSIGFLFRFDFAASFQAHPLGIPALALLLARIIRVFKRTSDLELSLT